jgi:hypothetical protein
MAWKSHLKADNTDWLLEDDNPSVKYFTLTTLLDKNEDDREVKRTKNRIGTSKPVTNILSKQTKNGCWGNPEDFYVRSKYKGTVWSFLVLAELGTNGESDSIKKAADFIFIWSQDRKSGGFSYIGTKENGGRHSMVIPCLTGNMVYSMIRFGLLGDPRTQQALDHITRYMRFDDGAAPPDQWPYNKYEMCYGKHTCHMSAAKILKALAEVPEEKRTPDIKRVIEEGVEYFLIHHIHKRSHDLSKVSKPGWLRFGFPLMYQTDALDLLDIITSLGYKDDRMQEAVDLVISKQQEDGRWLMQNSFNGKMAASIETKGKPSKWITLRALRSLKRYYG